MLLGDPEYAANMSTDVRRISSEDGSTGNWKVVPPAPRTVCESSLLVSAGAEECQVKCMRFMTNISLAFAVLLQASLSIWNSHLSVSNILFNLLFLLINYPLCINSLSHTRVLKALDVILSTGPAMKICEGCTVWFERWNVKSSSQLLEASKSFQINIRFHINWIPVLSEGLFWKSPLIGPPSHHRRSGQERRLSTGLPLVVVSPDVSFEFFWFDSPTVSWPSKNTLQQGLQVGLVVGSCGDMVIL